MKQRLAELSLVAPDFIEREKSRVLSLEVIFAAVRVNVKFDKLCPKRVIDAVAQNEARLYAMISGVSRHELYGNVSDTLRSALRILLYGQVISEVRLLLEAYLPVTYGSYTDYTSRDAVIQSQTQSDGVDREANDINCDGRDVDDEIACRRPLEHPRMVEQSHCQQMKAGERDDNRCLKAVGRATLKVKTALDMLVEVARGDVQESQDQKRDFQGRSDRAVGQQILAREKADEEAQSDGRGALEEEEVEGVVACERIDLSRHTHSHAQAQSEQGGEEVQPDKCRYDRQKPQ